MAKSIEQLQKEADALQAKAAAAKKKLREAERATLKKQQAQERKNDTRRKILFGGFMFAKLKQNNPEAQALYKAFLASLDKDVDTALFDKQPTE